MATVPSKTETRTQTIPAGTYKWINISTDDETWLTIEGDITCGNITFSWLRANNDRLQTCNSSGERDYIDLNSPNATFRLNSEGTWTIQTAGIATNSFYDYTNYLEAITETTTDVVSIYMKNGKALCVNRKAIKPKKTAAGETWVLDSIASYDDIRVTFNANFTSNGLSFSSIELSANLKWQIKYDSTVVKAFDSWTSEAYRTITFLEPPTGDLLAWLQANGTKQQHQHIGGKD